MTQKPTRDGEPDREAVDAFIERAERAASLVHRVREADLADLIASLASGSVLAFSPTFQDRYAAVAERLRRGVETFVPSTAEEAARAGVGVSIGEAIVVETGSVLVAEHDLQDRLVSMLSPTLIQVVDAGAVLHSLDEAGAAMRAGVTAGAGASYFALVTGPSRSADIERSLTIGVQGPAELHIVLCERA